MKMIKHNIFLEIVLTISLVFVSCQKDEVVPVTSLSVDAMEIKTSYTTADIVWNVESAATISEVILEYSPDSTFIKSKEVRMSKPDKEANKYVASLDSLENGTSYYIRCKAINKINSTISKTDCLRTWPYQLAKINTDSITQISVSTATLHGTLVNLGSDQKTSVGFYFASHKDVSVEDSCIIVEISELKDSIHYSYSLSNLVDNVTYYARAFARNVIGVSFGEELSFITKEIHLPEVAPTIVAYVSYTDAICKGEVLSDGGGDIIERGFCYSTTPYPTLANEKKVSGEGKGTFSASISGLTANTTYYVRAFARNSKGTMYGEQAEFKTKEYALPSVSTSVVTKVKYTTATCGGNVSDEGGQEVTAKGICYSTSQYPTVSDYKVSCGSGIGDFECDLSNLSEGTTYYVRAYAINSVGINYGEQIEFTTIAYSLATVTTDKIVVLDLSAICQGTISSDGGSTVTECGICYSTQQHPTIADSKVACNSGIGTYSCAITQLTNNITYYFRAYAINSVGVSYGDVIECYAYPIGAIPGEFSISVSQKIVFSRGNLQFLASTQTWRFAEHQYDYIGSKNNGRSETYPLWIDLLCWGSSNPIQPLHENTSFYDLGNNLISNGGNTAGTWRTLSSYELDYILNSRQNASNLKGFATIGTTHGYVLLPDDWQMPAGLNFIANASDWTTNQYSETEWNKMQLNGAIFFPCAGYYDSGTASENTVGCYWLSTPNDINQACFFDFYKSSFNYTLFADILCTANIKRGHSIRLVNDVNK